MRAGTGRDNPVLPARVRECNVGAFLASEVEEEEGEEKEEKKKKK